MKQAKNYFDNHDTVSKLYFTSDNLAFFDEQNAINHSKSLDDETVTIMTRAEADKAVAGITDDIWSDDTDYDPLDEPDAE